MYCPKCGTNNIDGASFCRACGTNLSLVPQALTGHLPEAISPDDELSLSRRERKRERKRNRPPSIERAVKEVFSGLAFICVAIAVLFYAPAGHIWWFWMLIPAFMGLGDGVAEFIRYKQSQKTLQLTPPAYVPPAVPPAQYGGELPARNTADLYPPVSVTENTTRLLDRDK
jgi:zinc-ribbon domain